MLGDDQSPQPLYAGTENVSEGLQALTYGYSADQDRAPDDSQPRAHYEYEDSPIDPFGHRDTLRPDDSASIAPYRSRGPVTFNSETYSVVNSVLNMYHQSPVISPELASVSRERVQQVSPVIAQHKDWGSKEATETYLARLLSDANGSEEKAARSHEDEMNNANRPSVSLSHVEEEAHGPVNGGTAIIYPSESRRYSRGSRGSTTTTIQDDASRSGSSFEDRSRSQDQDQLTQSSNTGRTSTTGIELPQLAWTNGGLGLSYHEEMPHSPSSQNAPPRPAYSPPPPPIESAIDHHTLTEVAAEMPYRRWDPDSPSRRDNQNDPMSPTRRSKQPPKLRPDRAPPSWQPATTTTPIGETTYEAPQSPLNLQPSTIQIGQTTHETPHPARLHTPVKQSNEQDIVVRYGTPPQFRKESDLTPTSLKGATENGLPDPAKQALIKRYRILEELLTTEHQFCIDMMIAHNIFEATAMSLMSEKEKKVLFSNCKELEKFSHSLFRAFKKAAKPIINYDIPSPTGPWNRDSSDLRTLTDAPPADTRKPSEDVQNQFENCTTEKDHDTTIGQVFLENAEKMERLYTTYYLNQDNAAAYMKKRQADPDMAGWVSACFEQVENMTQAWDLDSLLLKPCQRLLKYPLLLDGLENASDASHPDLPSIKAARKELLAISARINEAKKRADTFRAATSEGKKEKTKGKGIGKQFVKAFIPKVDKNKAYDEADKAFKDQDYKSREQKFGGHFFQLQIVIRDFEQYLDAITEHYMQLNIVFMGYITICETAPSVHPETESTWRKWAMAHFELQSKALEDHVSQLHIIDCSTLTSYRKLLFVSVS